MSGPYDTTHRDFWERVRAYAKSRASQSPIWKGRLFALDSGISFERLASIHSTEDAIDELEEWKAAYRDAMTEFSRGIEQAYYDLFLRKP